MDVGKLGQRQIESSEINLEYQDFRLKDASQERALLGSIAERGIQESLLGIEKTQTSGDVEFVLLDGFKRLRCARKLGIRAVPWRAVGEDEAEGLFWLLNTSNSRGLHILEQSKMVDSLHHQFNIGITEIAKKLERSSAWVSVRLGVLAGMDPEVRESIFSGNFPARSYLYTLGHFTRVKGVPKKEIKAFVSQVAGHGLSGRQVDLLASGYFNGGPELRAQIAEGKLQTALQALQQDQVKEAVDLNSDERALIRDLEISVSAGSRILLRSGSSKLMNSNFYVQAEILISSWQRSLPDLSQSLERLYDRCREKKSGVSSSRRGSTQEKDRSTVEGRPKDSSADHFISGSHSSDCQTRTN